MPSTDLPVESPQKEMEPSTPTLGVMDYVEATEILAPISKAFTFEAGYLGQEEAVVPIVKPATQTSEEGVASMTEVHFLDGSRGQDEYPRFQPRGDCPHYRIG